MSEISEAVTVAVGPSAMADRISERVLASRATPPRALIPAITADARSEMVEASRDTVMAAIADLKSLMSDAPTDTPAAITANKLLKLLVRAASTSDTFDCNTKARELPCCAAEAASEDID